MSDSNTGKIKRTKTFALILAALVVLSAIAFIASAASFSLVSETAGVDACRGATTVLKTELNGAGDFSVKENGEAKAFTTTVPETFSTDGKQTIYSYITPPSNTKVGRYALTLEASDGSDSKTVDYEVNVKDCHGSSLSIDSASKLACPCENITFTLDLENMGQYTETFDLSAGGTAAKWITFSDNMTTIGAGEKAGFSATVNMPCNIYGVYDITFNAKARTSLSFASVKTSVDVRPCYEYELKFLAEKYLLCENKEAVTEFRLSNIGTAKNTFKFNVDGPKWASIGSDSAEVLSGAEKGINLTFSPQKGSSGEYDLSIESMSRLGDVAKKASTKLSVEECYIISLDSPGEKNICDLAKDYSYDLIVKNTGKAYERVNLTVEGPEWVSLKDSSVGVNSNDESKTSIVIKLPEKIEYGGHKMMIKGLSENGAETETLVRINIADDEECYSSTLDSSKDDLLVGIEHGKTIEYVLKNDGLAKATYELSVSGSGKEFSIINPEKIEVAPGKEGKAYLYVSPPLFTQLGDHSLKVSAKVRGADLEYSKDLKISVVEGANDTEPGTEISKAKRGFLEKAWDWIASFFKAHSGKKAANETAETAEESGEPKPNEPNITVTAATASNETKTKTSFFSSLFERIKAINRKGISEVSNKTETLGLDQTNESETSTLKAVANATVISAIENRTEEAGEEGAAEAEAVTASNETQANETATKAAKRSWFSFLGFGAKENAEANAEDGTNQTQTEEAAAPQANENEIIQNENEASSNDTAIGNTTGKTDLAKFFESKEQKKLGLEDYKYYIGGAVLAIAIVAVFASGFWKKIFDFFDED